MKAMDYNVMNDVDTFAVLKDWARRANEGITAFKENYVLAQAEWNHYRGQYN